ncbi:radical SAM/SPASM domain-containing protein [Moorella sulfitireducens (nom. illeg.)]|uniref:radical SAM/SPASM domain-containing protein n=1 Tax=Neomoorella sulfitireducens TaxID=2972948 RepID=UPI0021ABAEEE|nr:radical SAM/SPASM domain-containing protein [Moorella sulfitireducens]
MKWPNLKTFFQGLFPRRKIPVIQLEVTSRCQLKCSFCPHTLLPDGWYGADFPWELFARYIAPYLRQVSLIYFQGWGEPLLHPRLFDMMQVAKEQGCRVGFTSNGILLGPPVLERLVEMQSDLLGLSVAGGTPFTHAALRSGSNLKRLLSNISRLADIKQKRGSPLPKIICSYLMTRRNLHELPAFVELAAGAGADEVVATNLDFTLSPEMEELRVFACSGDVVPEDYLLAVQAAEEQAGRLGLSLRVYPLQFNPNVMVCDARPLKYIFVNSHGEVAPCVYLGLPYKGVVPRYFCRQEAPFTPFNYGKITEGLTRVIKNKTSREFKQPFRHRLYLTNPFLLDNLEVPAPPPPCTNCYKLYGL